MSELGPVPSRTDSTKGTLKQRFEQWAINTAQSLYQKLDQLEIALRRNKYRWGPQPPTLRRLSEWYDRLMRRHPASLFAYGHRGSLQAEGRVVNAFAKVRLAIRELAAYELSQPDRAGADRVRATVKESLAQLPWGWKLIKNAVKRIAKEEIEARQSGDLRVMHVGDLNAIRANLVSGIQSARTALEEAGLQNAHVNVRRAADGSLNRAISMPNYADPTEEALQLEQTSQLTRSSTAYRDAVVGIVQHALSEKTCRLAITSIAKLTDARLAVLESTEDGDSQGEREEVAFDALMHLTAETVTTAIFADLLASAVGNNPAAVKELKSQFKTLSREAPTTHPDKVFAFRQLEKTFNTFATDSRPTLDPGITRSAV